MKKMTLLRHAALVLLVSVFCFSSQVIAAKTVVVLAGVSEAASKQDRTALVLQGIKDVLKTEGIVPSAEWVDMAALPTKEAQSAAVDKVLASARAKKADLLVVLNDIMLAQVVKKVDDIPVVFGWIFSPPQYLGLPKANFTGVTRMSYAADNWIMAKQLLGAKTVALMSKNNPSMAAVKGYLAAGADKLEAASGVRYKDMFLVNDFAEWKKAVKAFPYDFIYLADTSQLKEGGKVLARAEVAAWTVKNAKVPVIAATEVDVEGGALFSIVTSEHTIGVKAGESALKILKGAAPSDVPYVTSSKGRLLINMKTAQQYKLDIPYDLLASADKVYE